MPDNYIRVSQRCDDMWAVVDGPRGNVLLAFNAKAHAIAYARAVSFAGKLKLFVDDRFGNRHTAVRDKPDLSGMARLIRR